VAHPGLKGLTMYCPGFQGLENQTKT